MSELGYRIESVAELERRLSERIALLRDGKDGKDGADGVSLTIDDVRPAIAEYVETVLSGWERPKDGESVTVGDVHPMLQDMVANAVAQLPVPKDGKDGVSLCIEDVRPVITEYVETVLAGWERPVDGRDGRDVDMSELERMIADAVAGLPPAEAGKDGKDADPEMVAELVSEKVREAVDALPPPEKGEKGDVGPTGALPVVKDWDDRVYYQGEVVSLDGALYQSTKDTGKAPPHNDWVCIVARGRDGDHGRSFNATGAYDAKKDYAHLDVVMVDGASFVADRDAPGACPGPGWKLLASRGRQGKSGVKGERGLPGVLLSGVDVDDDGMQRFKMSDGSIVECDFYPVLTKIRG